MISSILRRSLTGGVQVIPVEQLIGNCSGSRMPDVDSAALTQTLAEKAVLVCPTSALSGASPVGERHLTLDYAECIGCGRCIEVAAPAFFEAKTFAYCGVPRDGLVRRWDISENTEITLAAASPERIERQIRSMLGRALNIRQLDAGSCNGCEAEITALTNPHYDLERFGIHFVASPKHADMLLVTGPVTRNMANAVRATWEAVPSPKLVVAVGACGCSGGIFANASAVAGPVDALLPVDAYIPGCPPTPAMLVTGILALLREANGRRSSPRAVSFREKKNPAVLAANGAPLPVVR